MEITQLYAAIAGFALALLLISSSAAFVLEKIRLLSSPFRKLSRNISFKLTQYLFYPYIIPRHRFIGPWNSVDIIGQTAYFAVNLFCVSFRATNVQVAGIRAANLALINAVPLFNGPHLGFLADAFGLSLSAYRLIHRSAAVMVVFLLMIHIFTAIAGRKPFPLHIAENVWALSAGSALPTILILSHPLLRKPSYEVFLRTHVALGVLSVYATWRHLPVQPLFPRFYVYIFIGIFICSSMLQLGILLYRNRMSRSGCSKATISHSHGTILVRLNLSQPLQTEPGQYISLWIPGVSFWSFLQLHPFTVISWSEEKQTSLVLCIEPRAGFTRKLLGHTLSRGNSPCLALFSGPHGKTAPIAKYKTIIMIASGIGIAAQLPYLKKILHIHNTTQSNTWRVHLIWQLESIDKGIAMQFLLNDALAEDTIEGSYILRISVYVTSGNINNVRLGNHGRAIVYSGSAKIDEIVKEERARPSEEKSRDMLVMVSGVDGLRDEVRSVVQDCSDRDIHLLNLDYQPEPLGS